MMINKLQSATQYVSDLQELTTAVSECVWLSIDADEWTSISRRRYINISVFAKNSIFWNLGFIRITGSATTERPVELVEERLQQFGVHFRNNVVAFTTDGAPVAKKMAKVAGVQRQLCLAHGIHLGVCDILYDKKDATRQSSGDHDSDEANDNDDGDDEDEDYFHTETQADIQDFRSYSISGIIAKIRSLSVIFKQSTTYREKL